METFGQRLRRYRELSAAGRLDLETEANRLYAREHPEPSAANPYPKVRKRVPS